MNSPTAYYDNDNIDENIRKTNYENHFSVDSLASSLTCVTDNDSRNSFKDALGSLEDLMIEVQNDAPKRRYNTNPTIDDNIHFGLSVVDDHDDDENELQKPRNRRLSRIDEYGIPDLISSEGIESIDSSDDDTISVTPTTISNKNEMDSFTKYISVQTRENDDTSHEYMSSLDSISDFLTEKRKNESRIDSNNTNIISLYERMVADLNSEIFQLRQNNISSYSILRSEIRDLHADIKDLKADLHVKNSFIEHLLNSPISDAQNGVDCQWKVEYLLDTFQKYTDKRIGR